MATHSTVGLDGSPVVDRTPLSGTGVPWSAVCVLALIGSMAAQFLAPPRLSAGEGVSDPRLATAIKFNADGKYEEAVTVLEDVLNSSASVSPDVYLWLGRTRASLKQWAEAREAFTRYTEHAPSPREKADGYRAIARTHAEEKNTGLAKRFYGKALELTPNDLALRAEAEGTPHEVTKPAVTSPPESVALEKTTSPTEDDGGFWSKGLFGVCGGRSAWWGWVIGLIIYVPGLLFGAILTGAMSKAQAEATHGDAGVAAGTAFFTAPIGTGLWYIIYWGVPADPLGWCVLVAVLILTGGIAAGAAKS